MAKKTCDAQTVRENTNEMRLASISCMTEVVCLACFPSECVTVTLFSHDRFFIGLMFTVIGMRISRFLAWVGFLMAIACGIQVVLFGCLYLKYGWREERPRITITERPPSMMDPRLQQPTVIYMQDTGSGPVVVAQVQSGQIPPNAGFGGSTTVGQPMYNYNQQPFPPGGMMQQPGYAGNYPNNMQPLPTQGVVPGGAQRPAQGHPAYTEVS
ncbi:unnamed protein product [Amoebophrya sp. A120]|nr:unnamed protein product [Amoebophrya sp. A120]|eukprot:GSA120T00002997001.1